MAEPNWRDRANCAGTPIGLVSVSDIADAIGQSHRATLKLLTQAGVARVPACRATQAEEFLRSYTPAPSAAPKAVEGDADVPFTVTHEPTGWQVHPRDGRVYSRFAARPDRPLGSPNSKNGHLRANRVFRDGTTRSWQIAHVMWEAVNGQPVPDGWAIRHRNDDVLDNRYSNLALERVGTGPYRGRGKKRGA